MEFDEKWEKKMTRKLKKEHKEGIIKRFIKTFYRFSKESQLIQQKVVPDFDEMPQFGPVEKYRNGSEIAGTEDLCHIFNMFVDEINKIKKRLVHIEPNWEEYQRESQADADYDYDKLISEYDPH